MASVLPKAPGVSIDRAVAPRPPGPLATGVPAFLAAAPGPAPAANTPVRLTQWAGFAAAFGAGDGPLARAVRGFFDNGGPACYAVRLDDGPGDPAAALAAGLDALDPLGDVDLVAAPDVASRGDPALVRVLQSALLAHCDLRNDRFALLDARPRLDVPGVLAQRRGLSGTNGALYYPCVAVGPGDGLVRGVAPCGHVAGLVARTDAAYGVHKAPANAVLDGVLDLDVAPSDDDHAALNAAGVNAIRALPGRGVRVMGARTLSTDPAWAFVNTRRVLLTAARWMTANLAPLSFEPHDTRLWARVGRELAAYCDDLFRRGALRGRSPREAFFVKCDAETNPPEVRDAGRVVSEVGLAPVVPNEFVVVRIVQGDGGVTLAGPGTAP